MQVDVSDVIGLLPIVADRPWQIAPSGAVRTGPSYPKYHCPLSALAEEIFGYSAGLQVQHFANEDGALPPAFQEVVVAADLRSAAARKQLLEALGLTDPAAP